MISMGEWRFFTDGVMGGVSKGGLVFVVEDGVTIARMTGRVSTANRGGFIQMRRELVAPPPVGTTGVRVIARGNGERYFVHLRTTRMARPWELYRAGFDVTGAWSDVLLPLDAFAAFGGAQPGPPTPATLTSVAVVAYGRDHEAAIEVREVGFV
jgi:hypothetical protein